VSGYFEPPDKRGPDKRRSTVIHVSLINTFQLQKNPEILDNEEGVSVFPIL